MRIQARVKPAKAHGECARSDRPRRGQSHVDRGSEDENRQASSGFARSECDSGRVVLVASSVRALKELLEERSYVLWVVLAGLL